MNFDCENLLSVVDRINPETDGQILKDIVTNMASKIQDLQCIVKSFEQEREEFQNELCPRDVEVKTLQNKIKELEKRKGNMTEYAEYQHKFIMRIIADEEESEDIYSSIGENHKPVDKEPVIEDDYVSAMMTQTTFPKEIACPLLPSVESSDDEHFPVQVVPTSTMTPETSSAVGPPVLPPPRITRATCDVSSSSSEAGTQTYSPYNSLESFRFSSSSDDTLKEKKKKKLKKQLRETFQRKAHPKMNKHRA